jgi:hypothetical protein
MAAFQAPGKLLSSPLQELHLVSRTAGTHKMTPNKGCGLMAASSNLDQGIISHE